MNMAKVVDIKQYKTSKVLIKELSALITDYEYILRALVALQTGLGRWSKYRSPLIASYKLEETKIYLQHEVLRLKATIKLEKELIDDRS